MKLTSILLTGLATITATGSPLETSPVPPSVLPIVYNLTADAGSCYDSKSHPAPGSAWCEVNAKQIDHFRKAGMMRYRVQFSIWDPSGEPKNEEELCKCWTRCCYSVFRDVKCYQLGSIWVVDDSEVDGPVGQGIIDNMVPNFIRNMEKKTGCYTAGKGPGKMIDGGKA